MRYSYYLVFLFLLFACKKEVDNEQQNDLKTFQNGLLVLNEGLFQQNNSTLSWLNLNDDTAQNDIFLTQNERFLGDTGNDIQRYGGKIYIVVNASSTIEVLDAKTLKSVKQIDMKYNNVAQQPRSIGFYQNKAYVSSFDGYVNEIDTAQLIVTNRIKVGENPEGLSIASDQLFVANSGGLNFPNVDSTVFQINLNDLQIVDTFVVGKNPGKVVATESGNVFVVKRGDYGNDPSELINLNTQNGVVENTGIPASSIYRFDNELYITYLDESTQNSAIAIYNLSTQSITENNIIDGSQIQTLYGIAKLPDETIVCMDAMGYTNAGYLRFFNVNGNLIKSVQVGLNPNNIIYYE
jgi:hypothetical protein